MVAGAGDYARALICSWLINAWQALLDHPLAALRRQVLTLWNEEPGEISLSMLAQSSALHTNRKDVANLGNQYSLLFHQRGLLQSIPGLDKQQWNRGQPVLRTSPDVLHSVLFSRRSFGNW